MAIRTGWQGEIRAAAAFAANDTYYACTTTVKCDAGADTIRLRIASADASSGNVTIKAEVSSGAASPTYAQLGGDLGPVAVGSGETKEFVLPLRFCAGDVVRISFKASAGATTASLSISALAYVRGDSVDEYNRVTALTAVADSGATLTVDSAPEQVITGGASNYVVSLPDATTVDIGQKWTITNASTEIAIVKNYGTASSVMEWLMPGDTLTCVCTSAATAAGAWAVTRVSAGVHYLQRDRNDFQNVYSTVNSGFRGAVGGGGIVLALENSLVGIPSTTAAFAVGTSVGGYSANLAPYYETGYVFGVGAVLLEFDVGLQALSTALEEYIIRLGFGDSVNASDHTDGVYFEYDRAGSTGGADIWKICAASNSTRTKTETETAPVLYGATSQRCAIVVNSTGTRADFWVNETHLGTVSANIPKTLTRACSISFGGTKTAGTTQRYVAMGYVEVSRRFASRR